MTRLRDLAKMSGWIGSGMGGAPPAESDLLELVEAKSDGESHWVSVSVKTQDRGSLRSNLMAQSREDGQAIAQRVESVNWSGKPLGALLDLPLD